MPESIIPAGANLRRSRRRAGEFARCIAELWANCLCGTEDNFGHDVRLCKIIGDLVTRMASVNQRAIVESLLLKGLTEVASADAAHRGAPEPQETPP